MEASGLPRRPRLLMELLANRLMKRLANPLSHQSTVAKWLDISQQAGKSLVIAMTSGVWHHDNFCTPCGCCPRTEKQSRAWPAPTQGLSICSGPLRQAKMHGQVLQQTRCRPSQSPQDLSIEQAVPDFIGHDDRAGATRCDAHPAEEAIIPA
jgi:hypothetical protein